MNKQHSSVETLAYGKKGYGLGVRDAWVEVHSYGGVGEDGRRLGLAPWAKPNRRPNLVYFICVSLFTPNPNPNPNSNVTLT
jgi:hypothetical protein